MHQKIGLKMATSYSPNFNLPKRAKNKIKFIMKKAGALTLVTIFLASCVSQKKFTELEELQQNTKNLLDSTTVQLNTCNDEKEAALAQVSSLTEQNKFLTENNQDLINNIGNSKNARCCY